MSRGPDKEICKRCPKCRLTDIYYRMTEGSFRCRQCAFVFKTPFIGNKYGEQPKSGQIAGRIEIGRGMAGW